MEKIEGNMQNQLTVNRGDEAEIKRSLVAGLFL
jgi:hypothetical protein